MALYAVSYGNGNDGVSHMYPDFYCHTDKPYDLARLALITSIIEPYQQFAADELSVDGEEDDTISATLDEGPDGETEFGAAFMIAEVFPISEDDLPDQSDPWAKKPYASLEDGFGADVVAKFIKA